MHNRPESLGDIFKKILSEEQHGAAAPQLPETDPEFWSTSSCYGDAEYEYYDGTEEVEYGDDFDEKNESADEYAALAEIYNESVEEDLSEPPTPSQGSHEVKGFGRSRAKYYDVWGDINGDGAATWTRRTRKNHRQPRKSWKYQKSRPQQWTPDPFPRLDDGRACPYGLRHVAKAITRVSHYDKPSHRYDKHALAWDLNNFVPDESYSLTQWLDDCATLSLDPHIFSAETHLHNYVDGAWRSAENEDADASLAADIYFDVYAGDYAEQEEQRLAALFEDNADVYCVPELGHWSFISGKWVAPHEHDVHEGPQYHYSRTSRAA